MVVLVILAQTAHLSIKVSTAGRPFNPLHSQIQEEVSDKPCTVGTRWTVETWVCYWNLISITPTHTITLPQAKTVTLWVQSWQASWLTYGTEDWLCAVCSGIEHIEDSLQFVSADGVRKPYSCGIIFLGHIFCSLSLTSLDI